jgi:hypothetical protein
VASGSSPKVCSPAGRLRTGSLLPLAHPADRLARVGWAPDHARSEKHRRLKCRVSLGSRPTPPSAAVRFTDPAGLKWSPGSPTSCLPTAPSETSNGRSREPSQPCAPKLLPMFWTMHPISSRNGEARQLESEASELTSDAVSGREPTPSGQNCRRTTGPLLCYQDPKIHSIKHETRPRSFPTAIYPLRQLFFPYQHGRSGSVPSPTWTRIPRVCQRSPRVARLPPNVLRDSIQGTAR